MYFTVCQYYEQSSLLVAGIMYKVHTILCEVDVIHCVILP